MLLIMVTQINFTVRGELVEPWAEELLRSTGYITGPSAVLGRT